MVGLSLVRVNGRLVACSFFTLSSDIDYELVHLGFVSLLCYLYLFGVLFLLWYRQSKSRTPSSTLGGLPGQPNSATS